MRRNEHYIRCCESGGKGTYAALYRDFGDVRSDSFQRWWRKNGEALFSEPAITISMQVVSDPRALQKMNLSNCLMVVVPLTLDKNVLKRRFERMLKIHHQARRGGNMFTKSLARYKFACKPVADSLEKTLKVYDLSVEHPDWPLWKIGQAARVSPNHTVRSNQPLSHGREAKNVLAGLTSRFLKNAKTYIKNVGTGEFPKK